MFVVDDRFEYKVWLKDELLSELWPVRAEDARKRETCDLLEEGL